MRMLLILWQAREDGPSVRLWQQGHTGTNLADGWRVRPGRRR